jgi:hypothetical protein
MERLQVSLISALRHLDFTVFHGHAAGAVAAAAAVPAIISEGEM